MRSFETPESVAKELVKHAPRNMQRVLDPSVGSGRLLIPLMDRMVKNGADVYCVDLDERMEERIDSLRAQWDQISIQFFREDFLSWTPPDNVRFDCIVMNPPFLYRTGGFREAPALSMNGSDTQELDRVPIEAAFVVRAIGLLRNRGRLLMILPCSVVMAQRLKWIREVLNSTGAIHFVHELPPRTFPGVDSRMYLVVFEKGVKKRRIKLLNHDLQFPEKLEVSTSEVLRESRLDFRYFRAIRNLKKLRDQFDCSWELLGEAGDVTRGICDSVRSKGKAMHSGDLRAGFWRIPKGQKRVNVESGNESAIRKGDILAVRVGRGCSRTFGVSIGAIGVECTDCVLMFRPHSQCESIPLLFALKVVSAFDWAQPLLERGTGASYMTKASVENLCIPRTASTFFPIEFKQFKSAIRSRSSSKAAEAVDCVVQAMGACLSE